MEWLITIGMMLLSSIWGIFLVDDFLKIPNNVKSDYLIVNIIIQMFRCPLCVSAHLFWISYLIIYGSMFGFILCPVVYYITFLLEKYIFNVL